MQGDEDDADIDADEPTYCYCNGVSYGEMVACDADECPREWFHLECVGLKVAPTSKGELSQEQLNWLELKKLTEYSKMVLRGLQGTAKDGRQKVQWPMKGHATCR